MPLAELDIKSINEPCPLLWSLSCFQLLRQGGENMSPQLSKSMPSLPGLATTLWWNGNIRDAKKQSSKRTRGEGQNPNLFLVHTKNGIAVLETKQSVEVSNWRTKFVFSHRDDITISMLQRILKEKSKTWNSVWRSTCEGPQGTRGSPKQSLHQIPRQQSCSLPTSAALACPHTHPPHPSPSGWQNDTSSSLETCKGQVLGSDDCFQAICAPESPHGRASGYLLYICM
jgi:hypothetical protein